MILDVLESAEKYVSLNPHFAAAFEFLQRADLADLFEGHNTVDGDNAYAIVIKGPGRKPEDAQIETHDNYIDIQYVVSGIDTMGWKARKNLGPANETSDSRNDVAFYDDMPDAWTVVTAGMFAIYFPEDAHMPMISDGDLHKVVIKVAVS